MKKSFEEREELILQLLADKHYVPMKEKELAVLLRVEPEDRDELSKVLQSLLKKRRIQINKRGKYSLYDGRMQEKGLLEGTFISHAKGFGFVEVEGFSEDFFIPESKVKDAFHMDTVQIRVLGEVPGKRKEAEIVAVLKRGMTQVVGTFETCKSYGFVIPDNPKIPFDIYIAKEHKKGAVDGHKVVVELLDYGKPGRNPEGKVAEILGHKNDPGVDILSLVHAYGLNAEFPERVMNQAQKVRDEVIEADFAGREDLRDWQMVTIDGEDAKDLDDAVSLSMDGENYVLGVHIADVSNYVQENSALDREALARGTSVYLVDRVIPMLPHTLSNGICSLNEGCDRLSLSCIMNVSKKGEVVDYRIAESVIRVNKRMDYTTVNQIIEKKDETKRREFSEYVPMLDKMADLSSILQKIRKERGSIDFDFPETKILLDKEGKPLEIRPYERNSATRLIESFMLLANETVAQHFYWLEVPFIYRTHDNPDPEKIMKLSTFIYNFGYKLKIRKEEIHPKEIQKLLGKIVGTAEEDLISRLALRSMKQAKYTIDCSGHFGLACPYYCHFTSPIRRYPDLQIHRIIKDYLRGRMKRSKIEHYEEILPQVANLSSKRERLADEAERETEKLKKAQYMENFIGQCFDGVISSITEWGIYVELPNTVEGMIHVSKLPGDYFTYDEEHYEMVGTKTGIKYELGQRVKIKVHQVDMVLRTIDFLLAEEDEE